ncbi:MAG: FtsX-like permease family protein [Candidatus Thorarchaeota archaeon]
MKLFFKKAWRDLKRKKIRSIPIIIVIIIGGFTSIMYGNMYIEWAEATQASWGDLKYHHLQVTVKPNSVENLTRSIIQAKDDSEIDPDYEIRSVLEAKLITEQNNFTVRVYGVNSSRPLYVDKLYYHKGAVDTLYSSKSPNVTVIDQYSANENNWPIDSMLTILTELIEFDVTTIALVDSPEYMIVPGAATEFFEFWADPVLWMRYTDLLKATNNSALANQLVFHFKDPSKKNTFLTELLTAIGVDNVLKIEGRNFYVETIGLEMFGMAAIMMLTFSGIAAVLLFIVLKRFVEEETPAMGLFKSLGFTNREVLTSALFYSLIISLIGGIIGSVSGAAIGLGMSDFLIYEFSGLKKLPTVQTFSLLSFFPSIGYFLLTCIFTAVGSLFAVRKIFSMRPVDAMRPKTTFEPGKTSRLEKIAQKIREISPLTKFSFRSITKRKAFFIFLGIFLATFISLFGSTITVNYQTGFDKQINYYQNWDIHVIFRGYQNSTEISALLQDLSDIDKYEPTVIVPIRFSDDLSRIYSLTGLAPNSVMRQFDNDVLPKGEELIISKDLALKFKVGIDDRIALEAYGTKHTLTIGNIINELSGSGIYGTIGTARMLAGIGGTDLANGLFIQTSNPGSIAKALEQNTDVYKVINKQDLVELVGMINSVTMLITYVALFGGLLVGVSIAVTIVSISISERKYDFVNFRALGVSNQEIFFTVLLELIITGIGGIILGIIGSIWMINVIFDFAASLGVILISELSPVSLALTIANVILGIVLATYLSLRSLFRTSISEETVSRIIG